MTDEQGHQLGEDFKASVFARTGLKGRDLVCPREKSEMTPCVARDGGMCVAFTPSRQPLCVGCEEPLEGLLKNEQAKAESRS